MRCGGSSRTERGPFFGRDSIAAIREVVRLQHVIVGAETAVFDEERVAVAV